MELLQIQGETVLGGKLWYQFRVWMWCFEGSGCHGGRKRLNKSSSDWWGILLHGVQGSRSSLAFSMCLFTWKAEFSDGARKG